MSLLNTLQGLLISLRIKNNGPVVANKALQDPVSSHFSDLIPPTVPLLCHCHTGLLIVTQTHQEDSYPRAFAFTIFSTCMLSPQISILFAFLLHDDVCPHVTFSERSSLSTLLKKKKKQNSTFPSTSCPISLCPCTLLYLSLERSSPFDTLRI